MRRVLAVIGLLIALVAFAAPAQAIDVPLINVCPKVAPMPEAPNTGVTGLIVAEPDKPNAATGPADPTALMETSGFSGMQPFTYDLGCKLDPASYGTQLQAWADQGTASKLVLVGQTTTALADAIDRLAWDPSWIGMLLGNLATAAIGVITRQVLIPFLGLGLLFTTLRLRRAMQRGDTRSVMQAITWSGLVLALAAFVSAAPVLLPQDAQAGMAGLTNALHSDGRIAGDPATAATDTTMQVVHYNGWLRREFGTSDSDTATKYGRDLLAATRITWAEQKATDPSLAKTPAQRTEILAARKRLLATKAAEFQKVAAAVKRDDPSAYAWLTGRRSSTSVAAYEMGFALVAGYFRIALDLVMVLCLVLLAGLGLIWLVAVPYLVTPDGERTGRRLLDSTTRTIGYFVSLGIGSWLFSVFTGIVMQPGWPPVVSIVFLLVGSWIFWTALRPERKIMSLLSDGRVYGNGRYMRRAHGHAKRYLLGGAGAIGAAALVIRHGRQQDERDDEQDERVDRLEALYAAAEPPPVTEPVPGTVTEPVFERDVTVPPVPPPAGTVGDVPEMYDRDYDLLTRHYDQIAEARERAGQTEKEESE